MTDVNDVLGASGAANLASVPSAEPLATFAEQRFEGKRRFQLYADRLVVCGHEALSAVYEQTIKLESLQPEMDRLWRRSPYYAAGAKQAAGFFIAALVLRHGFSMAWNTFLSGLAGVGTITGLLLLLATWRRVEYAVFKTVAGVAAVSVARAGRQADGFDAFVQRLSRQIQTCAPPSSR